VPYFRRWPVDKDPNELLERGGEGISVFPSLEGLRRHLAERDLDVPGYGAVVLAGEVTGDRDAEAGALLIRPRQVLGMCPLD
jgi:hypothetical protein